MWSLRNSSVLVVPALALMFVVSVSGLLPPPVAAAHSGVRGPSSEPSLLPSKLLVSAPPPGASGPDDITLLALDGIDHGRALVWTAFQNGVNPDGTPGRSGGPTQSTIAGYDGSSGSPILTVNVTGKVDGLTADPQRNALIATVNEDVNSALDIVHPTSGTISKYTYSPDPAVSGNGGTDSIAIRGGQIYLAHSNPNDTSQPAEYRVALDSGTMIAHLMPVFFDDSAATDVLARAPVTLALTDPDTNSVMPQLGERFAGTLVTVSQADGRIVFASHLHDSPHLEVLNLSDNRTGNVPPIDGFAVATCGHGTLYVVDASANTVHALDTTGWPAGTVFVGEPKDNGNPLIGTLNLNTGQITPLGNHFLSPKGLVFASGPCGDTGHGSQGGDAGPPHEETGLQVEAATAPRA